MTGIAVCHKRHVRWCERGEKSPLLDCVSMKPASLQLYEPHGDSHLNHPDIRIYG
jgi:hypothetical protein